MTVQKRQLLKSLVAVAALSVGRPAWPLIPGSGDRTGRPLKILMLGGRRFVGPAIVSHALARGHEVTLFNRGRTNPDLFRHLELLSGDRQRQEGLAALQGGREWDVVVDTWAGDPRRVKATAALLGGRVGHYAYISSIAVYGGELYKRVDLPATVTVPAWSGADETLGNDMVYPARKAHAERYVQAHFPDGHSIYRCHGIRGLSPHGRLDYEEPDPYITPYWLARMHKGGSYLAPGETTDTTQWIDVQDVGHFVVHCLEQAHTGPFNLCQTARWGTFLQTLDDLTGNRSEPVWVPASFLFERNISSFTDIPNWVSHQETGKGFFQISNQRALDHGLSLRPLANTYADLYEAWLRHHHRSDGTDPTHSAVIGREEARLLAEWAAQQQTGAVRQPRPRRRGR
jgi:2'-hydroxyisoflavone reductase